MIEFWRNDEVGESINRSCFLYERRESLELLFVILLGRHLKEREDDLLAGNSTCFVDLRISLLILSYPCEGPP